MRRIAILGSGAREHALCWKLSKSLQVEQIFCIPGNAGTEEEKNVRNVNIQLTIENFERLVTFSKMNKIDLVVVGPEEPLMNGITDLFKSCGIACFGPSSKAAIIESSKVFSKDFMMKYHIPTASYKAFSDYKEAVQHIENLDYPFVIKASGLASGKGVFLPETIDAARDTLRKLMIERLLGKAGSEVVIEQRLSGTEISGLYESDTVFTIFLLKRIPLHQYWDLAMATVFFQCQSFKITSVFLMEIADPIQVEWVLVFLWLRYKEVSWKVWQGLS